VGDRADVLSPIAGWSIRYVAHDVCRVRHEFE
jgi:hypothetical protein